MKYIQRRMITIGQENGTELDTGKQILLFLVTPKVSRDGKLESSGADFEQQKAAYKAIKYLRGDKDGCSVELGDYIALEDAWYDLLMYQAKQWRWGINDPAIVDMIEEWEKADDKPPLQLVKES